MTGNTDAIVMASGSNATDFYNLVVDKPSDKTVSINSTISVNNDLTINAGDLTVNGAIYCPSLHLPNGTDVSNAGYIIVNGGGSIWIQQGASLQGNGEYYLQGDFLLDGGMFTPGTSWVIFNGTGTQTISSDPVSFYNLGVNKVDGTAQLGAGSVTVTNQLNMWSGNLDLNGADLELTGNGTIIGEDADSYVYSTSGGVVNKTVDLNAPASENPGNIGVTITSSANLGSTTIQRGHEVQDVNGEVSIERYYDISPANNSGLDATVRFHYLDHELNGLLENDLAPFSFNGIDWDEYLTTNNDDLANWVETNEVDAFSVWTLAQLVAPLPVELVDFQAKKIDNSKVQLTWKTASEINNEGFEIEHSTDGRNWDYLDFVDGNGTSNKVHYYEFSHENPSKGVNYYRLRQLDFDGQFEYSVIRSVEFDQWSNSIQVFPNPATTYSNIQLPDSYDEARIIVSDLNGRTVFEQKLEGGNPSYSIDVSTWQSGMYLIQVQMDGRVTTHKLQVIND